MIATQGTSTLSSQQRREVFLLGKGGDVGKHRLPQPRSATEEEAMKSKEEEPSLCPLDIPTDITKRRCVGCSEQSHTAVDGKVIADRKCRRNQRGGGGKALPARLLFCLLYS